MQPVEHVVEQLWAPALVSPDLRVVLDTSPDATWSDVERYWLVPGASSARLLVPVAPRGTVARTLTNYRRLRTRQVNAVRLALSGAARAGVPLSRSMVSVQVRRSRPEAAEQLPLAKLSLALDRPLFAATGVRTSDNRKTTLHLVDESGQPVGYAKVGWNGPTDDLVANEGRVLRQVGGLPGPTRAPRVLAEVDYDGHPIVVTEPLPLDAHGSLTSVEPPTAQEMFFLTPVSRRAAPSATRQLGAMIERLGAAAANPRVQPVARAGLDLATRVGAGHRQLPVTTRWHGDMTPWNRARDAAGQLWVWDWESSEDDAVAGLDPLHWAFGTRRLSARHVTDVTLDGCLSDAGAFLTALGLSRGDRPTAAAVYALTVVERACVFADHSGSWSDAYIGPRGLEDLLLQAHALLDQVG